MNRIRTALTNVNPVGDKGVIDIIRKEVPTAHIAVKGTTWEVVAHGHTIKFMYDPREPQYPPCQFAVAQPGKEAFWIGVAVLVFIIIAYVVL